MGMAEREGFEPPGPFGATVFKTTPPQQDTRNQLKTLNIACPLVVLLRIIVAHERTAV